MYEENDYIMWLSRIKNISSKKLSYIIDYFGSATEVWHADKKVFKKIPKLTENIINSIINSRDESIIYEYINELYRKNIKYITINDKEYPTLLKEIPDPPIVLYIIGELPDDSMPKISIVGSRKCTEYGEKNTIKIAKNLAENNIVIVSGMAKGIDGIAHRSAIEGKGKTIAILGNGVDICYPAENSDLREKIIKNGCILSEFPPSTPPYSHNFPIRNRIISGLSLATIVIEAKEKSGTLITVKNALEQGRDVFALPGNVNSKYSTGTNDLIKQGAFVITSPDDIFNNLRIEKNNKNKLKNKDFPIQISLEENDKNKLNIKNSSVKLDFNENLVYDCISFEPIRVDEILTRTNLPVGSIQAILTLLELKGLIKRVSGQRYILS